MSIKANIPAPLQDLVSQLEVMDREERSSFLIELSEQFTEAPPDVAVRPFPQERRVPNCESEVYVWATDRENGSLDFHYVVENPYGVSAKAVAVALKETLSGQPLEKVAAVPPDTVDKLFGRQLAMGKGEGLRGMFEMTAYEAKRRIR